MIAAPRFVVGLLVVAGLCGAGGAARADSVRAPVVLVRLGHFDPALERAIVAATEKALDVRIVATIDRPLPKAAWYKPRSRYRADALLDFLDGLVLDDKSPRLRVLGLTEQDISTTKGAIKDWGVFGLGQIGGRSAVISSLRLKRGARDAAHLAFRVSSTATHELGHTLGLPHCPEASCVMQDAEGSIKNTDTGTGELGPACRAALDRLVPRDQSR